MLPLISVVIVNWNGGRYLLGAVRSIFAQGFQNFECIVVDNASNDSSLAAVELEFGHDPRFFLIKNSSNLGYCGGSNTGLRAVRGQFVATINPDVVLTSNFLENIPQAFEDPSVGIVAPCLTRESDPEIIDSAGTIAFPQIFATAFRAGTKLSPKEMSYPVFGAIGAGAIYRLSMLQEIATTRPDGSVEFFDEDFFTYYDEHDLQIRAKWLGWKALYCPELRAQHAWRHSVKIGLIKHRQLYHYAFRNYYLSMIKTMPVSLFIYSLPAMLFQELGILAISLIYRSPIFLSAKLSALPKIALMLKKRKIIMGKKRISNTVFRANLASSWAFLKFLFGVMSSEYGDGKLISFENATSKKINK